MYKQRHYLTLLMMACAFVIAFCSCQKDKIDKNADDGTQDTPAPTHPDDPAGDGIIENAVTDVDGNTYRAVKLGDQVWMAENSYYRSLYYHYYNVYSSYGYKHHGFSVRCLRD